MSIIKEQSSDDEPVNKKEQETPKESSPEKKDIEKAQKEAEKQEFQKVFKTIPAEGFKPSVNPYSFNTGKDLKQCEELLESLERHSKFHYKDLRNKLVEEIAENKKELTEVEERVYQEAFNTDFMLEEKDLEEYGEEVYQELYAKQTD